MNPDGAVAAAGGFDDGWRQIAEALAQTMPILAGARAFDRPVGREKEHSGGSQHAVEKVHS